MDDAVTSYTYDGYNNRIGKVENGVQTSYLYDNRNRLTKETVTENGQTAITSYQYDPNGNLYSRQTLTYGDNTIQEPKASAVLMGYTAETNDMLLEYNNFNQLTTVTKGNGIFSYDYYANGLRRTKYEQSEHSYTTTYYWDGQNMVGEMFMDSLITYLRGHRLIAVPSGENTLYYHFNGHGDVTITTDMYGNIYHDYQYDAFGNLKNPYDWDYQSFRYCGEYYDVETGFIYLRARYYDPSMGRFISEDPVRDGLNWYVYANNNPVNYIDPWGLKYHWIRDYGDVTWDASTSTASLTIAGETHNYRVTKGGTTFIQDGKMYVDDSEIYKDFGFYAGTKTGEGSNDKANGYNYASALLDELIMSQQSNGMILVTGYFYQYTYAQYYARNIYNQYSNHTFAQAVGYGINMYLAYQTGGMNEALEALADTNPGFADFVPHVFQTENTIHSAIQNYETIMNCPERYSLYANIDNYDWIKARYNVALQGLISRVNNADFNNASKYYARTYIYNIINMNNNRWRTLKTVKSIIGN